MISFTLNRIDENEYVNYVKRLINKLFRIKPSESIKKNEKGIILRLYGKAIVEFFISKGIIPGDKVINQIFVPYWIKQNKIFILYCLKGLFDTDGSVSVDKSHRSIILTFSSASYPLARDFKEICEKLGIQTQPKIINREIETENGVKIGYKVKISSKFYVRKFLKTINPEKWKDPNRRAYNGMKLIISNSSKNIQTKIRNQIARDFPEKHDRSYSIDFKNYLRKLCLKYKLVINNETIENAIKKALSYENEKKKLQK